MSTFDKPHLDISNLVNRAEYKSPNTGGPQRQLLRIRQDHGQKLIANLEAAFAASDNLRESYSEAAPDIDHENGSFVEIELSNSAAAKDSDQQRVTEKTRQGAVKVDEHGTRTVALFVPDDSRDVFEAIFQDYAYGELTDKGQPKKKSRVEPIENIRQARLLSFWRDNPDALPEHADDAIWWALWCFADRVDRVVETAEQLGLQIGAEDMRLHFPETVVVPVHGQRSSIEILLFATAGIAELRRASDNPYVFTNDLEAEIPALVDDLADRVEWPGMGVPAVCLLDTGVNRAHPLIEPSLSPDDLLTLKTEWGGDDHAPFSGHGTGMAGLALHGDLVAPLAGTNPLVLNHRLESVKILPPGGFPPNEPHSYGPITQSAISIAEVQNPDRDRVFCMAITNTNRSGAEATAWSAALDQSAAGVVASDPDEHDPKRLIFLAAGNIPDDNNAEAIGDFDAFPAEDPAQAWNAVSVGGVTQKTQIVDDGYETWSPSAQAGEPSPYGRNSVLWDTSQSPFKPEVVFEAGNRAISADGTEAVAGLDSLSLLTTSRLVDQRPLDTFWATSSATAQAARFGARLCAEHPDYWPETIRALMIHSANWTPPMIVELNGCVRKAEKALCLRRFGYGVPNYARAAASAVDDLALIAENTIHPYRKEAGSVRFNEGHLYELPWPREILEGLENTKVKLKVTLSYFIEPNPSFSSAIDPARYQSFGLRFDLKRSRETVNVFRKRCNKAEREEGYVAPGAEANDGWQFGPKSISAGSLHCDIWEGEAVELASRNHLFVYPITGWWRERAGLKRYNDKARYSLVVSLETPDAEIDLYTHIENRIDTLIEIQA